MGTVGGGAVEGREAVAERYHVVWCWVGPLVSRGQYLVTWWGVPGSAGWVCLGQGHVAWEGVGGALSTLTVVAAVSGLGSYCTTAVLSPCRPPRIRAFLPIAPP